MALMEWSTSLNTNVQQIDEQHIQLLDMINELHDAMIAGTGTAALGSILERLITYTITHFSLEEQLMTLHEYPGATTHKNEHDKLVRQVDDLHRLFASGKVLLTLDVMMFLRDWLMEHIKVSDRQLGTYLNEHGIS